MVRHTGDHFINEECITIASMLKLQSSSVQSTKFDTPEADRLSANGDAPLGRGCPFHCLDNLEDFAGIFRVGNERSPNARPAVAASA